MYPPVSSVIYTLFEQLGMTVASLMYFRDRLLMVVYHNNLPGPNKKKAGRAIYPLAINHYLVL